MIKELKENIQYVNSFKYGSCCDELIYHTVLNPVTEQLNIERRNSLRYVDWNPKREYTGGLPLVLNEKDYDEIINSHCLFCRKVDEKESKVLLEMLDKHIVLL